MQSKSLLIAIAAFAVTATGVHAYGGTKILNRAGLSEEQVSAIEEAQELRATGDFVAARDKLVEAGINENTLHSIKEATHAAKRDMHEAVEDGDYEAFKEAITDSPLADIITSEADFELFREAHELKEDGQWEDSKAILTGLGFESEGHLDGRHPRFMGKFTEAQLQALQVARQANDHETIKAVLDEAGVESHHHRRW